MDIWEKLYEKAKAESFWCNCHTRTAAWRSWLIMRKGKPSHLANWCRDGIIDELYGGKITVVQLVLTIPNSIDFVKNYDKIGI